MPALRRALCVGIDDYPFGPLRGCVNDANSISDILRTHDDGSPNFDCKPLLAPVGSGLHVVTAAKLRESLTELFQHKAEVALLHFSGHGTTNNLDGYLVTQDAKKYDERVPMGQVLKLANDSQADEVVILLDCCYSGRFGSPPVVDNSRALLREGVSILTASRGDQVSVEVGGGGVFTSLVADAFRGGAADLLGQVTAPSIYSFVEAALGAWDQRPLFKSHLAKLVALRRCEPSIERAILRDLPKIFPVPAEDFQLTPEYEHTSQTRDSAKVDIFCKLQALARVHLVLPVGAPHMYDAAINSKACRLTASGRYYWRLARDARL